MRWDHAEGLKRRCSDKPRGRVHSLLRTGANKSGSHRSQAEDSCAKKGRFEVVEPFARGSDDVVGGLVTDCTLATGAHMSVFSCNDNDVDITNVDNKDNYL